MGGQHRRWQAGPVRAPGRSDSESTRAPPRGWASLRRLAAWWLGEELPSAVTAVGGRASGWFFAFVFGVTVVKSAGNAAYLSRRSPEELPWLYMATAAVVALVSLGAGRLFLAHAPRGLLRQGGLVFGGLIASSAFLSAAAVPWALPALYVSTEAAATALAVAFWAWLGDAFDPRVAKRVLGRIGAAGMAGAIAGGVAVQVATWLRIPPLLSCVAASGLFVVAGFVVGRAPRLAAAPGPRVLGAAPIGNSPARRALGTRLALGLALLTLALSVETAAVDYVFRLGASRALGFDELSLAALFGQLHVAVGLVALVVQSLFTRTLLERLGVFVYLSVVPLALVGLAGWAAVEPQRLLPLALLKGLEMVGSLSLYQPAVSLLYTPMPPERRRAVRAVVDGAVKKLGGAVGGAALLVSGVGMEAALGLVLGVGAGALFVLQLLRPWFRRALSDRLGGPERAPVIDLFDRATRVTVLAAVDGPDPEKAKAALALLGRLPRPPLARRLGRLLEHPDPELRAAALAIVKEKALPAWRAPVVAAAGPAGSIRSPELILALAAYDLAFAQAFVEPWLDRPDTPLGLFSVAVSLLQEADPERTARALERLAPRWEEASGGQRAAVVEALGSSLPLDALFRDPDPEVRRAALAAAASGPKRRWVKAALDALAGRETAAAATALLEQLGDRAVPALQAGLEEPKTPPPARRRIPAALRRVGTDAAAEALLEARIEGDAGLAHAAVREALRLRRERPRVKFDRDKVARAALFRLGESRRLAPLASALAASGFAGLLTRAVADRARQELFAGVSLLGLVADRRAIGRAADALVAGPAPEAVELIDVSLEGWPERSRIIEHLELPLPVRDPALWLDHAEEIRHGPDRALALLAHATLRRRGWLDRDTWVPAADAPEVPAVTRALIDKVFVLEDVQLFRGLSVDDLTAVADLCEERHAAASEVFYRQGEPGDSLYVLVAGEVRLERDGSALMTLLSGDSFGQVSLLDGGARPVTAVAGLDGALVLALARGPFLDLVEDRPLVASGLFAVLARRLRELVAMTGDASLPIPSRRKEAPGRP